VAIGYACFLKCKGIEIVFFKNVKQKINLFIVLPGFDKQLIVLCKWRTLIERPESLLSKPNPFFQKTEHLFFIANPLFKKVNPFFQKTNIYF